MDVTPLIRQGSQVIQAYAEGKFRISGVTYETPVIVTAEGVIPWNVPANFADLNAGHFDGLKKGEEGVDVILLGTGAKMMFLAPTLKKTLKERGLSVDAMDTGAACRTYNVLMAEGRRVAAALFPYR